MPAFLFRYAIQRGAVRRYLCMVLEGKDQERVRGMLLDWTHTQFPSTIVPEGWEYIPQISPIQELTC